MKTPQLRPPLSLPCLILLLYLQSTAGCSASAADHSAIRLSTSVTQPNPDLQEGYQHLQKHAFDSARTAWQKALHSEPNNTDALLALAAIARHQNQPARANDYLQQALAADPLDARIQAVLANRPERHPAQNESRLKNLLEQQPHSPDLHFALGNHYARQRRWPEAQAAYFNAASADRSNPDYLFNLAVSLDRMGKAALAAEYYRGALAAAGDRAATFPPERVEQRLSELAP